MASTGTPITGMYSAAPTTEAPRPEKWSSGICGCTDNWCNCCMVVWCPCVTYGQISTRVGTNGCCDDCGCCMDGCLFMVSAFVGVTCCQVCLLRQAVAKKVGLPVNSCNDCLISCFCGPCVMCQMANHLELQKDGCSFSAPPKMEEMQR